MEDSGRSLKVFNHRTNVELNNRIVCFDIKELGKQLKKIGMLIVQDQVWNRVTINRSANKSTRYFIDEFHLLLKEEQEFVLASRTLGAGNFFIIFKEVLPNNIGPIITQVMFSIPTAIFTVAFLSFVGLGTDVW